MLACQYFYSKLPCGIICSGFVPAFEKIGRTCHLYFTRNELILLHNVLSTDGVQAIANLSRVSRAYISRNNDRKKHTREASMIIWSCCMQHWLEERTVVIISLIFIINITGALFLSYRIISIRRTWFWPVGHAWRCGTKMPVLFFPTKKMISVYLELKFSEILPSCAIFTDCSFRRLPDLQPKWGPNCFHSGPDITW